MAVRGLLDAVMFSGVWVAVAATALVAAVSHALAAAVGPAQLVLAFAGTLAVYEVDRLRDVARDAATSPRRAAFVRRRRNGLLAGVAVAASAAAGAAIALGWRAVAVAVVAGGLGALHRRFKTVPFFKAAYVAAAWLAVTVGLPAWTGVPRPAAGPVAWACLIVGPALVANAIAFSARDVEGAAARLGVRAAMRLGLSLGVAGVLVAAAAPAGPRGLLPVPLATVAALAGFRRDERYVDGVVDGALVVGALLALTT